MYKALYREFRPETFEEVVGQAHVVRVLRNQLKSDCVSHAYIFCGTRGTGKTTMARLLAKGLNCMAGADERPCGECEACHAIREGVFMDVVEIDAASNNSVDNIRDLRESVKYPPAVGRKKVYIIDEVHMLSDSAANALLKTLEEPPAHVVFILATTEPHKLPQTILSRCLRLDFKRIPNHLIIEQMKMICKSKGVDADDAALQVLATAGDGSARDGLSLLEQCLAGGSDKLSEADVLDILGFVGDGEYLEMVDFIMESNIEKAIGLLDSLIRDGKEVKQFAAGLLGHYRNLMISKYSDDPQKFLAMSAENALRIKAQADSISMDIINDAIMEIADTLREIKWSTQARILTELCILKLISRAKSV